MVINETPLSLKDSGEEKGLLPLVKALKEYLKTSLAHSI